MQYYVLHYFNFQNAGTFMLVSFVGLALVLAIILSIARLEQKSARREMEAARTYSKEQIRKIKRRPYVLIESFYEMVFSSTSILFFLALYYIIDGQFTDAIPGTYAIWVKYQDILLLVFLFLSVFMTNWFDVLLVRLTHIKPEQKAAVRLTSSLYVVLILLYIRFIYNDTNYNTLIMYFITLFIGRFIYFDFTWKDFMNMLHGLIRNIPLMLLMVAYSAVVCWYGFHVHFLLKSNGVIISTLIAHLFMDLAIFIVYHTKLVKFFI